MTYLLFAKVLIHKLLIILLNVIRVCGYKTCIYNNEMRKEIMIKYYTT